MRIAFFSTKPYDRIWFEPMAKDYGYEIYFIELPFSEETMFLAKGYDAACIFVNDHVNSKMIDYLYENKVKALAEQGEPPAEIAKLLIGLDRQLLTLE